MDELVSVVLLGYLFVAGGAGMLLHRPGRPLFRGVIVLDSPALHVRFFSRYTLFSAFHMVSFVVVAGLFGAFLQEPNSFPPNKGDRLFVMILLAVPPGACLSWGWIRIVRWWQGTDPALAAPWWQKRKPPWEG
ncbi:MAG TPA: hypothetical protein VIP30_07880 [Stenotrophomonas sp.]